MRDDVRVTGGVGGTRARLDDLERCARVLTAVAADLEQARAPARRLGATVETAARVSPTTAPAALGVVTRLSSGATGIPAAAARARHVAGKVRRAARAYADTDAAVQRLLERWGVTVAHTVGEAGPLGWLGAGAALAPVLALGGAVTARVAGLRLLSRAPTGPGLALRALVGVSERRGGALGRWLGGPGLLPRPPRPGTSVLDPFVSVVAAFVVGAMPGRHPVPGGLVPWPGGPRRAVEPTPVRAAARLLTGASGVIAHATHGPTTLVVTPQPVPAEDARRAEPPRDVGDLVAGVADVYGGDGTPPGTVAVHRLEDPDGGVSWVVTIPGTQSGSLTGGAVPSDMTSNLALSAGAVDDVSTLVREALHGAGVPPDEPVQLVGHSQGGIAAMAVVNDPDVLASYDVRGVVTAGSPVAGMTAPEGVTALHLENVQDAVAAADGRRPPDRVNQTFVEVDLSRSDDPDQRAAALSWSGAHEVGTYARSAREAATVPDASIQHSVRTIESLLGGPGTTVTTRMFTGVRLPVAREGVG